MTIKAHGSSDHDDTRRNGEAATILFLAANPVRDRRLALDEECRTIEGKIRAAEFRDQIRFRSRWAARPDDLLQALIEDAPTVLHFSGHGAGDEGLCFQQDDDCLDQMSTESLVNVMRVEGDSVKVVVLNACFSEVQAQALVIHVPCVIGTPGAIGDKAAISYAGAFYRALASGKSVAKSHEHGRIALGLPPTDAQVRDVNTIDVKPMLPSPRLLTRADTDPSSIYIARAKENSATLQESVDESRVHIEIVIDTDLDSFDEDVLAQVMAKLRRLSGDQSVRMICVRKGSVRLTISLSLAGAKILMERRRAGQLTQVCGLNISTIVASRALGAEAQELVHTRVPATRQQGRAILREDIVAAGISLISPQVAAEARAVPAPTVVAAADRTARRALPQVAQAAGVLIEKRTMPEARFYEHVVLHREYLHRLAFKLSGSPETAKDLVQETFCRALQRFDKFEPGTNARAWLMKILTNYFFDLCKHDKVVQKVEGELGATPEAAEHDSMIETVSDDHLYAAIQALEPELREVIELCYLKQMRYREAAEVLGVPLGTIGTRLLRARVRLKLLLTDMMRNTEK